MVKSKINKYFPGSYWGHYNRIQKIILISLIATSLLSFVVSWRDIEQYAGKDLRNKVVGARYLLAGLDPYVVEVNPPSEWFLDPPHRYPGVCRITVTPLVLMFYCPFARLPYLTQRIIWGFLEWLALLLCILVLMRIAPPGMPRFVFLVFSLLFFVSGFFWRLHVEKGQFYIFLTLILSLSVFFDLNKRSIIAAILLGLLAVFRPTFLIILPLLLLLRRWQTAGVMALACVAIFTLSLIVTGVQVWDNYVKNAVLIQRVVIDKEYCLSKFGVGNKSSETSAEGIDFAKSLATAEGPVSFSVVINELSKRIHPLHADIILQLNKIVGVCFIILCFILAFLIGTYSTNQRLVWLFILAVVLNLDYFTPLRWQYVDVMFLPVIALIVPLFISPFVSLSFPVVVTSAFLLSYNHTLTLFGIPIANRVRSVLFMTALNILIVSSVYQKVKSSWRLLRKSKRVSLA